MSLRVPIRQTLDKICANFEDNGILAYLINPGNWESLVTVFLWQMTQDHVDYPTFLAVKHESCDPPQDFSWIADHSHAAFYLAGTPMQVSNQPLCHDSNVFGFHWWTNLPASGYFHSFLQNYSKALVQCPPLNIYIGKTKIIDFGRVL